MSGAQWRDLMGELDSGFRLLAPDLYGYGQSDPWPGPGPLTMAAEVEIVARMMAVAGGSAHLVAHSYGGAVALHALAQGIGKVLSLAIYEPVAFHMLAGGGGTDVLHYREIHKVAEAVWRSVADSDNARAMQGFVDYWNGAGTWAAMSSDSQEELARRAPKVGQDFSALFGSAAQFESLSDLRQPSLLLAGERTPAPTQHLTDLLATALQDAEIRIIADAGHMGPVTHRRQVNTEIVKFLRRQ